MDEQTSTMPPVTPPVEPPSKTMTKQDHWSVQIAGGVTLASTIVSGLSMWYLILTTRILA